MQISEVANRLISTLDPINCSLSLSEALDRKRTNPLFVIPNRIISTKEPPEINKTHCANWSAFRLLANKANPPRPKTAIIRFPDNERKLSSLNIFDIKPVHAF